MKNTMNRMIWTIAAMLFVGRLAVLAQVALTVSPSGVSNTYSGVISLSVTGLTNGEKVSIQRWIDLNGNGVIDASEPMMDAFDVTDNDISNAIIGGVTNVNVPIDINSSTGAITTTLNFVPAMALENMVGHYVYRVVSPTARFAPVTATFSVAITPMPQSLSGTVYQPDGLTPMANAVVVALDQQQNRPGGAVIADANGHYFLPLPPSSYNLIATLPNYCYDMSAAPSVVLTNGMNVTNNLVLTNGTATLSGRIFDAGSSNGIGGLLMTLQSGNLFAVAFSDPAGNYSAAATPSFWQIQLEEHRMTRRMYVNPNSTFQFDVTSGIATNGDIGLPKAGALFYGRITDNSGAPFANIEVDANDNNDFYNAKGFSDQNGYYAVAVLGDVTNAWWCGINNAKETPLANFVLNGSNPQAFTPGLAVLQNFVALPATDLISGHVSDNTGASVVGVGLNAWTSVIGTNYQSLDGFTDNSGNYSIRVPAGQWNVQFFTGNNNNDTLDHKGLTDITAPHIVRLPPTNAVLNLTVYPIGTPYITQPQRTGLGQFGFNLNGAPNVNYTVQVSTNIASTNWSTLLSIQLTNTPVFINDLHATNSLRFYRILKN
jgi:hypothetical protein